MISSARSNVPSALRVAWCSRNDSVFECESTSADIPAAAADFATMLTQPFGPTTSFTKNAVSLIIGPQPASYQPIEPSANVTCKCP